MTRASSRLEGTPELSTSYTAEPAPYVSSEENLYTKVAIEDAFVHSKQVEGSIYLPKHIESDTALLYAPGFMEFQAATAPLARELAKRGLVTITMKPLREQPEESKMSWKHFSDPLILQQQVIHALLKATKKQYGLESFDLAGHSMGADGAVGAAYHEVVTLENRDIDIRSVVGDQPLGFDNGNLKKKALRRLWAIATRDLMSVPKMMEYRGEGFNEDAFNHIIHLDRIALEGLQCLKRSKVPLRATALRTAGVKVGATTGENDNFFRSWAVKLHSSHILDGHWEIPGADHLHANAYPADHAEFLKNVLTELNDGKTEAV